MELTRKLLASSSLTLSDQRLVTVICSTGEPDRMGDVIVQKGIDLSAYRKNPVVLWGHSADVPIARAVEIDVKDGKLQATVQFPPEGDDEDSDWVYGKIKAGIVNATSVGFIPKDYEPLDPKSPWGGFKFLKSELLEFSFVSVPANSGCLIVGRSLFNGVDVPLLPSIARSTGEIPVSDEAISLSRVIKHTPIRILEEAFRLAKRQKYLKAAEPEWKVCAAGDLLVVDSDGWDGAAAAKRILSDAGFDGDSPDFARAARGFLIHDAANPALRSSYLLPFADIVDGELKAIKSAIAVAKGRIDQSDAPAAVRGEAKEIAAEYESKAVDAIVEKTIVETIIEPVEKAGRKISNANAALLQAAMDHHASATKCIKDVLDGNTTADPDDDGDEDIDPDIVPTVTVLSAEDLRAQRIAEAATLKASVKI